MKLLLQADISKLGYYGDVVEVSDGYARNYLLPQNLAIRPTEANIKAIEKNIARSKMPLKIKKIIKENSNNKEK